MTTLLGKIRLLRTTSSAVSSVVLEEGRLVYLTDENSLVSGDGVNTGSDLPRIFNLSADSDPALAGNLDLNGHNIINDVGGGVGLFDGVASGDYSIACGTTGTTLSLLAYGDYSIAIGHEIEVSGDYSTSIGRFSRNHGDYSTCIGYYAYADKDYSIATGNRAKASNYGQVSHAVGGFGHIAFGQNANTVQYTLYKRCTNDYVPEELFLNGTSERLELANNDVLFGTAQLACVRNSNIKDSYAYFTRKFVVSNVDGVVSLTGDIETIGTDISPSGDAGVTISADDTNKSLKVEVSGTRPYSNHMKWMCRIDGLLINNTAS